MTPTVQQRGPMSCHPLIRRVVSNIYVTILSVSAAAVVVIHCCLLSTASLLVGLRLDTALDFTCSAEQTTSTHCRIVKVFGRLSHAHLVHQVLPLQQHSAGT